MKKLLFVMMLMAGLTATAQTGHLTSKGVPIDGDPTTFVNKLKQKGFTVLLSENGITVLEGDFAAIKGCNVAVFEHETKVVNRVAVMFPVKDTWATLYNEYSNLKQMLTEKYGEPAEVEEKFQGSYVSTDNDKMHEVYMDRCQYICDWVVENGAIELRIQHATTLGCRVVLVYIDAKNESKVRSSAIDDL